MTVKGSVIILLTILIYFGIHFFLYFSAIKIFSIENRGLGKGLATALIFLALSFLISTILVRFSNFSLFRLYYTLSAFWTGFLFISFISVSLGWTLIFLFQALGINAKMVIGGLVLGAALLYSFYGFFNAFNPVVKEVEIKIKNLSEGLSHKNIIQLSDVHLGRINGKSFALRLVKKVNSLNPDLILITGDLFDGMGSDVDMFINILGGLEAGDGIYFVTGNHEGYLGSDRIIEKMKKSNIRVLENELIEIDGLQIIGISYPEFNKPAKKGNLIKQMPGFDPEKTNILLYHLPASIEQKERDEGTQQLETYWSPNTDFSFVKDSGIDLQLSGHTHAGQFFPFTWVSHLVFNGFSYGLVKDGDFNLYTTSGTGTWGPPIRTVNLSEIAKIKLILK